MSVTKFALATCEALFLDWNRFFLSFSRSQAKSLSSRPRGLVPDLFSPYIPSIHSSHCLRSLFPQSASTAPLSQLLLSFVAIRRRGQFRAPVDLRGRRCSRSFPSRR